ncbi:MAG: LLM class flavin-dependent oxidoreductase [SAR202 cluster bacterium]|nr:LLM class flavin-dependent oxidoreductase [SAR202 cluster bacterium]
MAAPKIGLVVVAADSASALVSIERAEALGIPAVWFTSSGAGGGDAITLFASAAVRTQRILMGTSITQFYTRHPVALAQQVQVVAQLAPGRFRLGLGSSGQAGMERMLGVKFQQPLGHLREYMRISKALLQKGAVDMDGKHYQAHAKLAGPLDVPVIASALGASAYRLCGAEADGAISWLCPSPYLRDVALPALRAGAQKAGRDAPPLIAHAAVCVHASKDEVRAAVKQQFGHFARAPFYQKMFAAAGFPEAAEGVWSDAMSDAVCFSGDEAQVTRRLRELSSIGADEIYVSVVAAGADRTASTERALQLLGHLGQGSP